MRERAAGWNTDPMEDVRSPPPQCWKARTLTCGAWHLMLQVMLESCRAGGLNWDMASVNCQRGGSDRGEIKHQGVTSVLGAGRGSGISAKAHCCSPMLLGCFQGSRNPLWSQYAGSSASCN